MYYLYLDESGDLGHYVDSPGSSRYFVITVLEVSSDKDRKALEKAVERTIKNKLHAKHSKLAGRIKELKGASTEELVSTNVSFVLDRRTGGASVQEFNKSLRLQLEERIPPQIPLFIDHRDSSATRLLQAVDLFAWGIFRKYEAGDASWYDIFQEKIKFERVYPDK